VVNDRILGQEFQHLGMMRHADFAQTAIAREHRIPTRQWSLLFEGALFPKRGRGGHDNLRSSNPDTTADHATVPQATYSCMLIRGITKANNQPLRTPKLPPALNGPYQVSLLIQRDFVNASRLGRDRH
jgi:hypothetical protein